MSQSRVKKTPRYFEAFIKTIRKIWRRYNRWLTIKEDYRRLLKLDDRMLEDLGLRRDDVMKLTTGYSFWKHMYSAEQAPLNPRGDENTFQ